MSYDFICQKCNRTVTVEHSMTAPHPARHKGCGGHLRRVFAPSQIVFKGAGFYTTDRRLDPVPEEK